MCLSPLQPLTYSSTTLVSTQWHHVTEDRVLNIHSLSHLKSQVDYWLPQCFRSLVNLYVPSTYLCLNCTAIGYKMNMDLVSAAKLSACVNVSQTM